MAFFLFILVNAALFIRPAEIVESWQGLEIYFYLILTCAVVALPDVVKYLTAKPLDTQPITLCVFGLLIAILIPPLLVGDVAEAWRTGFHFAKVLVYYLLFVSVVNTPARLRTLLACMLAFCVVLTGLAVLQYHGLIDVSTIRSLTDSSVTTHGEVVYFQRLQGTGIFHDPNELCMMLAAAVPLCLYFLLADPSSLRRLFCGAALLLFGYAIYRTGSRGGFLAMVAGLGVCAWVRYGWQRTLMFGAVGLPALLLLFGGRQTEITGAATGQTRVQLWSDWLQDARGNAPFGTGMPLTKEGEDPKQRLPGEALKHLAHNSYLQAFADLGLPGGVLFLGAFALAAWSVYRAGDPGHIILNRTQRDLRPYVLASVAAYVVGLLSLSIVYSVQTYFILALATAYGRTTVSLPPTPPLRLDVPMLGRLAGLGAAFLLCLYVFVRLFVNWA